MIRSALVVFCVVCVATVLSETLGLAFLWHRGQLSTENLREIRAVLRGESRVEQSVADEAEKRQPSAAEVMRVRAMSILDLENREQELHILKTTVVTNEDQLIANRTEFEQRKRRFEEQLAKLLDDARSEATEQGRAILQALAPDSAAGSLMQLDLDEAVVLLKGMPEKNIARILKEFQNGPAAQQQRGKELFEAITRGEPKASLIEGADEKRDASRETASEEGNSLR
ncbi:MAG: hypothetical protein WD069_15240 [Planctomycetales bacterium]